MTYKFPHVFSPPIPSNHPGILEELFHHNTLFPSMVSTLDHQFAAFQLPVLNIEHDASGIIYKNITDIIIIPKFEVPTQNKIILEVVFICLPI